VVVAAVDEDERNEVVIRVAAVMVVDKASADDDLDFRIRCFLALLDLPMFVDARSWKDEKGR
jgi:dTDP-4-dehydrorhamnose reductase